MLIKKQYITKLIISTFLILNLLNINTIHAQKNSDIFKDIDKQNFNSAQKKLQKIKKKQPTVFFYASAMIYSNPNCKKYNPAKAYRYTKYANKYFKKANNKNNLAKSYNINAETINQLQDNIAKTEYDKLTDNQNVELLNKYIRTYNNSSIINQVTQYRDSLAFSKIKNSRDFRDFQFFAQRYPKAKQKDMAQKKCNDLWKALYNNTIQTGELLAIKEFEYQYPKYPFYNKEHQKHKEIAQWAINIGVSRQYNPELQRAYTSFIKSAAPKDIAFVTLQLLIQQDLKNKNYQNACDSIEKYKPYFSKNSKQIDQLCKIIKAKAESDNTPTPIPGKINTDGWEYSASITGDDRQIVFCGRDRKDNLMPDKEDIFYSQKDDNGLWQEATPISELNTPHLNEAPLFITNDGTQMLIFSEGNIYISKKTPDGWSKKKKFPQISTPYSWEADAMLTADGNALLFISDRRDNIHTHVPFGTKYHGGNAGNSDIYVSIKKAGQWQMPINLGASINTPYAERSPFLHSDMKTLYFSSDGHVGLGQKDVFVAKRLNGSSWTQWSKPINLGKAINTPNDEWGYKISEDGTKAYFSRLEKNVFNIYQTELPEEFRPESTTIIYGTITTADDKFPQSKIIWENLQSLQKTGYANSDPKNGHYIITLPNGKNYGFYIETDGYYPVSGNIDLTQVAKNQKFEKNFILTSIQNILSGEKAIPLENIFFEYDKHNLKKESYSELNRLADFLNKHKDVQIEISGHSDNKGSENYNLELSLRRAKAVADYIVQKGFPKNAIITKGYGSKNPVADNNSAEGRAKNRRVEFKIIKN